MQPEHALTRAQNLAELGRWSDALETLRPALTEPETAYDGTCLQAQCLLGLERPGQARVAAERAVALEPDLEWAHRLRAIALLKAGHKSAALTAAREAARIAPHDRHAQHVLALTLAQRRRSRNEAAQVADRMMRNDPTDPLAHETAGHVAMTRGDKVGAEQHYRDGLGLAPDDADLARHLGIALQRQGRRKEAAGVLVGAARQDPANPRNRELLGRLGAPALGFGALFLGKYLVARLAIGTFAVSSGARAVVVLGGIMVLGSIFVWMRFRGLRHLPPDVRQTLVSDHRNYALLWVLGFGVAAVVLGVVDQISHGEAGSGWSASAVAQVVLGVAACAAYWRLWRGARPDPFPTVRGWFATRRFRRSAS